MIDFTMEWLRLSANAKLPEANGKDAMAIDLCSAVNVTLTPGQLPTLVDTGVVLSPESYDDVSGMVLSLRSGFALKNGVTMANGVGLIEKSFTGFEKDGKVYGISCALVALCKPIEIKAGYRIAQLISYGKDGNLLIPDVDFSSDWAYGSDLYMDKNFWYNNLGPGVGGRGGFGSTGQ